MSGGCQGDSQVPAGLARCAWLRGPDISREEELEGPGAAEDEQGAEGTCSGTSTQEGSAAKGGILVREL